jgi:putative transposase
MKTKSVKTFYRRNLPHFQPIGASFFLTFRLYESIPTSKVFQLKREFDNSLASIRHESNSDSESTIVRIELERERFFRAYDNLLDRAVSGPHYLREERIAELVKKELHRFDGELYDLICYCIMSNHVHMLIDTKVQLDENPMSPWEWGSLEFEPLQNIMKRIKGATAVYANRMLNRQGRFWQRETYDRVIRSPKEMEKTIHYILDNPVKAGLVETWDHYPYTYLKP